VLKERGRRVKWNGGYAKEDTPSRLDMKREKRYPLHL
jgi:hypothetical protein